MDDDLAYYLEQLKHAIPMYIQQQHWEREVIGACLVFLDEHSITHRFCIVGEDELNVAAGAPVLLCRPVDYDTKCR